MNFDNLLRALITSQSLVAACRENTCIMDISLTSSPKGLAYAYDQLFTDESIEFIAELACAFKHEVRYLHQKRLRCWEDIKSVKLTAKRPLFPANQNSKWTVNQVPTSLKDRRIDLGDVSPANLKHFSQALSADVQGIQVDFDDGNCPSWRNQILGHYNVFRAVHGKIAFVPCIENSPVIMLRPRAWNMTEHNMMVDGEAVPGPLFDYGLHVFHNARKLISIERGPFFYLSKIESASEAELWDDIFIWTEKRFQIPIGTIKATVLIEDILAALEMNQILFALRRHSAGLNCGIWDYCASIIARFGNEPSFLMPDRNKYVNMEKTFLKNYLSLAVRICRNRGTFATGGMAASMACSKEVIEKTVAAKRREIEAGAAGFMVYDIRLIPEMKKLWAEYDMKPGAEHSCEEIRFEDLLQVPSGGATKQGLTHNIQVALLFIEYWLKGIGHFVYKNSVEDSATAEISRWQVRQWLMHQVRTEDTQEVVTFHLILTTVAAAARKLHLTHPTASLFIRLLTLRQPPQFITSFLSDNVLSNEPLNMSRL